MKKRKKKDKQSYQTYPVANQRTKKDNVTVKWTLKGIEFSATGKSKNWINLQDYYLLNRKIFTFPDCEKLAEDFQNFIISANSQIQRRGFREVKKSFLKNLQVQAGLIYSFRFFEKKNENEALMYTVDCMRSIWNNWNKAHGLKPIEKLKDTESFFSGYIQDGINIIKRDFISLKLCVGILKGLLNYIKINEPPNEPPIEKDYFDFAYGITIAVYLLLNPTIIMFEDKQIEYYKESAIKIFPHLLNHSF